MGKEPSWKAKLYQGADAKDTPEIAAWKAKLAAGTTSNENRYARSFIWAHICVVLKEQSRSAGHTSRARRRQSKQQLADVEEEAGEYHDEEEVVPKKPQDKKSERQKAAVEEASAADVRPKKGTKTVAAAAAALKKVVSTRVGSSLVAGKQPADDKPRAGECMHVCMHECATAMHDGG